MLKSLFSSSVNIPTLRLSGVIGQAGFMRSGLNIASLDKLIDKLFPIKFMKNVLEYYKYYLKIY